MAYRIFVAEDEDITRKHLISTLAAEGYEVEGADNGQEAFRRVSNDSYDLLIADIKMPGMTGLELLDEIKEKFPETEVIIITGFGSIGSAVDAMKKGALDYLPKPFSLDELILKVDKARGQRDLRKQNLGLKVSLGLDKEISLVAESRAMKEVLGFVKSIQDSSCSVLLTGESGVGKSLLARVIHSTSERKQQLFMSVNCAVFTEDLLASELFGHEKGSFTGAVSQKQGLLEITDGGTLYLDEIAEMPSNLQAKLLKVIEEQEFLRVGGTKPIKVDVRFIAATNRNIPRAIASGSLRRDIYYRLNVMEILIPPLRERKNDIEPLSRYFLSKHLSDYRKDIKGFSKQAMHVLRNYSFPGNVRELENIIERAIILEKGKYINQESLPQIIKMFQIETKEPNRVKTMTDLTRDYAKAVVDMLGGNRTEAARLLDISRTSLWRLLKED